MSASANSLTSGCLLDMPSGSKLRVDELTGSPADRSKLYSLGILPGTELEVCQAAEGSGNVCVRVRHCSLVLGEAIAEGVRCCPAGDESCRQLRRRFHRRGCLGRKGFLRNL